MKKIKEFFLINIFLRTKVIIFLTIAAVGALIAALLLTGCFLPNLGGEQDVFLDIGPKWSPDGTKIVFVEPTYYRLESNWGIICIMNADGSNKINLTNSPSQYRSPAWSPDGGKIVFSSQQNENEIDIFVMNADGSNKVNLTGY
jgi:hypothetical protein